MQICKICKEPIRRKDLKRGCYIEKRKLMMMGVKFKDNYKWRRYARVHKYCLKKLEKFAHENQKCLLITI